ncbi:hypothetical protein DSL64_26585 [Dyadobacter luteus]|jgi:hypothetical protein|uniref:Uncharacterized protein n=1 Tax=Dyadobacter luteus TaxID=2259619 RepID=A0A3D8Y466_9BACT|nr:hypothetical protein [Dyadobacter luteus]REA56492.1 hypothetical protein DSL64_26585 [Dyadobacter luteus]
MQFLFKKLLSEIQSYCPDFDIIDNKQDTDVNGEVRMVINNDPAKALQLCYWKNEFIQVDILPEYFPKKDEEYNLYIQFNNKEHVFTNVGGHCFIFRLNKELNLLQGEDAYDKNPDPVKTYSEQEFIDMILKVITDKSGIN